MPSIHEPHRLASVVVALASLALASVLACSPPPDACPACAQNAPGAADAAAPPPAAAGGAAAGADAAAEGGEDQGEDQAEAPDDANEADEKDGGAPAKGGKDPGEK